jgi:DNA (cytosine-5)-methyltransferase 1
MWKHMARIIGEVRPRYAFVENSPMLTTRGLGVVLADLSTLGFDAKWGVVSAADVGANHQRERIWIRAKQRNFLSYTQHDRDGWRQQQSESTQETIGLADSNCKSGGIMEIRRTNINDCQKRGNLRRISNVDERELQKQAEQILANTIEHRTQSQSSDKGKSSEWIDSSGIGNRNWWATEPNVGRVADGVVARVDRLKAIGNGQVPLCAATAWELLK